MSNELYQIGSWQVAGDSIECVIGYNKSSPIFEGHFPGNPIVPGVCTLQMVMELMELGVNKRLRLKHAATVKFLQLITPQMAPSASISWTHTDDSYHVTAVLKEGAVTLFKMNAVYAGMDEQAS